MSINKKDKISALQEKLNSLNESVLDEIINLISNRVEGFFICKYDYIAEDTFLSDDPYNKYDIDDCDFNDWL